MDLKAILIWAAVIVVGLLWWMRRSGNKGAKRS
jgi:hypothetical protein